MELCKHQWRTVCAGAYDYKRSYEYHWCEYCGALRFQIIMIEDGSLHHENIDIPVPQERIN